MSDTPATQSRALTPVEDACRVLSSNKFKEQVSDALPPGVDPDRFVRVAMTALRGNPAIAKANRESLYNACLKAAQDGLIPDGREGAFVAFGDTVQWMVMVQGIVKVLAECGIGMNAQVVYENDEFEYELGDTTKIRHVPPKLGQDRGKPIGAYAIARAKGFDEPFREVMDFNQIEAVRQFSRAKNGDAWAKSWPEMARKTVIRRLRKSLPITNERAASVIENGDELVDLSTGEIKVVKTTAAQAINQAINAKLAVPAVTEPMPPETNVIEGEFKAAETKADPPPETEHATQPQTDADDF